MKVMCRLIVLSIVFSFTMVPGKGSAYTDKLDEEFNLFIENYEKESQSMKLAQFDDDKNKVNDRQIIVTVDKGKKFDPTQFGVELVESFELAQFEKNSVVYLVRVPENLHYEQTLASLNATPHVSHAEGDTIVETSATLTDPLIHEQWYLHNIDMFNAWEIEKGSKNLTIALIDSGVNQNHPDLKNRVLKGYDFINDRPGTVDENGHGTHIAGIIAANVNNIGMTGLDHHVKILPIKVFQENGKGTLADTIKAINYAIEQNVDIINMSYVVDSDSKLEREALNKAHKKGILLVASSGNKGTDAPAYPASYRNVISVGATDQLDRLAPFSNIGRTVDLVAPGVNIYGTAKKGGYIKDSGTSFSAPMVSATASLLKAKNPDWTVAELEWAIEQSAEHHSLTNREWNSTVGFGRLNTYHSLRTKLENEPGISNTSRNAQKLQNHTSVTERFQLPYDIDWYTFTVDSDSRVTLSLKDIASHIDPVIVLYNVKNNKIEQLYVSDQAGMGKEETIKKQLEKGTYYVALSDYYGRWATKPYKLTFDAMTLHFTDVKEYEEEIQYLYEQGIIRGYPNNIFKPKQPVKRIQAVMMILREMGIDVENDKSAVKNPGFSDIKPGDYGYRSVAKAVELGFIKGKDNNIFDSYGVLTRGQMASILVKAYDLQGTFKGEFKDVPVNHWAYNYVNPLAKNGITTGYGDGTYRVEQKISREHFSLMLYRVIESKK